MSKAIAAAVVVVLIGIVGFWTWQQKAQQERIRLLALARAKQEQAAKIKAIESLPVIDLADWCGRSPADIARRFFGEAASIRDCCKDSPWADVGVQNWKGWKEVSLSFAVDGLRSVTFEPAQPWSEAEFIYVATQKFGLALPKAKFKADSDFHGYAEMDGNVRSVELISISQRHSGVTMLVLASAPAQRAFVPGYLQVNFNWYVEGAADRKEYKPPAPWK